MKAYKTIIKLIFPAAVFAICFFSGVLAFSHEKQSGQEHDTITKRLIVLVEHDAELKHLLVNSIEKARKTNPDPTTNPAQTLEQYYDFRAPLKTNC